MVITVNFQICICVAAEPERAVVHMYETASQKVFQPHTVSLFLLQ